MVPFQGGTLHNNTFFLVYFPGLRKNPKSDGSMEYIFFFWIAIIYFQGSRKKVQKYTLDFLFFPGKSPKLYYFESFLVIFTFFFGFAIIYFRRPRKNPKSEAFFGTTFFLDCHYLFPAGSAKSKKKRYCCAVYPG